ncbi:MAG: HigA family addiction module antitoxin [Rhodospirillaceae bacterium]|nr:HigA family addiction module antitoxin [Rhodospirillaceae bacterium]
MGEVSCKDCRARQGVDEAVSLLQAGRSPGARQRSGSNREGGSGSAPVIIEGTDDDADANPSHPGEVLVELYLEPLGMGAIELARRLHVPRTRIERLVKGDTALTLDTALRLR